MKKRYTLPMLLVVAALLVSCVTQVAAAPQAQVPQWVTDTLGQVEASGRRPAPG
jgi:hypothetical protein